MKAIRKYLKNLKNGFLIDFIPIMLLFVFVLYIYHDKLNFIHSNHANFNLTGNYFGTENVSSPEKMNTASVNNIHNDQTRITYESHSNVISPVQTIQRKPVLVIASDTEKSLVIEAWIYESKNFKSTNNWYTNEPEQPLKIEQ